MDDTTLDYIPGMPMSTFVQDHPSLRTASIREARRPEDTDYLPCGANFIFKTQLEKIEADMRSIQDEMNTSKEMAENETLHISSGERAEMRGRRIYLQKRLAELEGSHEHAKWTMETLLPQFSRQGCYTDDANACLGVAKSLLEKGGVADRQHAARAVAETFRDNEMYRGCPPSAKKVQMAVLSGMCVEKTGVPPNFPFEGGSFANGGGMRISPVAIPYLDASSAQLKEAVNEICWATHRHPEAQDFALLQAYAVRHALRLAKAGETFFAERFFTELKSLDLQSEDMKAMVVGVEGIVEAAAQWEREVAAEKRYSDFLRP